MSVIIQNPIKPPAPLIIDAQQFRDQLQRESSNVARWARERNINPYSVYRLLYGHDAGVGGNSRITAEAIVRYLQTNNPQTAQQYSNTGER